MSILSFSLPPGANNLLSIGSKLLSYLNSPAITFKGSSASPLSNASIPGFNTATVRLQCEKYEETSQAEISSLLLLDVEKGGKSFISDNIAPHPKTWNLSGYIADPTEILSNAIAAIPGLSTAQAIGGIAAGLTGLSATITNYILNAQATVLWNCFYSRNLVQFTDRNHKNINVGIANLSISVDPVIANKLRFSMTLREIKLYSSLSTTSLDNAFQSGPNLGNTPYSFVDPATYGNALTGLTLGIT